MRSFQNYNLLLCCQCDNIKEVYELSEYLNIGQSTLANFENGKRTVPIDIIVKLAQYFNVSTDYLLGLTSTPNPHVTNHGEQMTPDEQKMLDTYRILTEDSRQIVMGKALDLKRSEAASENKRGKNIG